MENSSRWINPKKTCAYHSGMKGHTIEEFRTLKDKIQTLIDTKVIQAKETAPNVRNNPLPDHSDEGAPIEVEVATPMPFEVEVTTPFTMMVAPTPSYQSKAIPWDYVAEERRKEKEKMEETCAAQGMTRADKVYTPEHLGGKSKDAISILSLLQNSETHKNALMKVLSGAYVPTNITSGEMSNMVGHMLESHKITFHEDELPPEGLSHNMALLITVQFEDKFIAREVIIHGNGSNPIYTNQTIPFIERKLGRETYHRIERVNAIEKDKWWSNKIESILLWTGYEPDKGLGKNLQVTTKPVQLKRHGTTFGLGYEYTWQEYQDWSPPWRGPYYPLEQPVPHLHQHQANMMWGSEEDEALAGIRKLFLDDEDMDCSVIVEEEEEEEEEEEDLTIQTMEKGVVLKNWTATPCRARRCLLLFFTFFIYNIIITYPDEPTTVACNKTTQHKDSNSEDLEEDVIPEEIIREVKFFENKPKSNLDETETVNLGYSEIVKETRISIHLSPSEKEEYIQFLKEYEDIFAWSYDDMAGRSTSIVAHKLPTVPMRPPVKQKLRKFKPDMSLKIKEKVTKQIKAKVLKVVEYPTWLAKIVPVLKKDGKVKVCVDYRDLNRASPKDDFSLPNIHILIDNCAKHELQSFMDCFAGYHQIWMDEEDAKKIAFITPWGMKIEVYVDDVIIKSRRRIDHIVDLRKLFNRLRRYHLKLNPAKCAFGVPTKKLLGFIVIRRGIELNPSKVKAIQDLPPPKNKKDVMSFLGRINYISRFIA
ncbi:uncharacterized protein [Nicotiana tomentosiformis]|uniref:uncharacterized protein n=1 Tax=Nicotiana tomentosiformis TaxID=4098 RepID=UPI00388CC3F9